GLGCQRQVQRNNIAAGEEGGEVNVFDVMLRGPIRGGEGIVGEHVGFEAAKDLGDDFADFAGAEDADGLAEKIEADEAVEGKVVFPNTVEGAMNFAVQSQEQANGVLSNGMGRIGGNTGDWKFQGF